MIVFIKDVEIGAFDWSAKPKDQIINFWIIGELKSGRIIRIFVSIFEEYLYKIKEFINQRVNCLLSAEITRDFRSKYEGHNDFEGKYIGKYDIPVYWLKHRDKLSRNAYHGIETSDGIILTWYERCKKLSLIEGQTFKFNVKQFGIIAWYPMED